MLSTQKAILIEQLRSFADKITANPADYGFDAGEATALDTAVGDAETAAADQATHQTLKQSKTAAALTALVAAELLFRSMAQTARFNVDVTDEKLADIGASRRLPPSRIGAPGEMPELSIEQLGIGFAKIRIIEPDNRTAKLPDDAEGLEISLVNGTIDPADGEADAGIKTFQTKARCSVDTSVGFARLRVYVRYIGRRAQTGPWSLPVQFSPPQP